jgi:predicted Fe-S protein YdhL (DUF1289 family)
MTAPLVFSVRSVLCVGLLRMEREQVHWNLLPEDIIHIIFSMLDLRDRGRAAQGTASSSNQKQRSGSSTKRTEAVLLYLIVPG